MNKKTGRQKAIKKAQPESQLTDLIKDLINAHTGMLESAGLNFPPHNDCVTKAKEAIAGL